MRFTAFLTAVFTIAGTVFTAPVSWSDQGLLTLGAGQNSCGRFLAAITGPNGTQTPVGQIWTQNASNGSKLYSELIRYQEWMTFVTGYNSAHEQDTDEQINIDLSAARCLAARLVQQKSHSNDRSSGSRASVRIAPKTVTPALR
ncbi:hypothetical protein AAE026_29395 [Bradyrhizobium sp. DN5]|uniref:hypothetical protein n=1 Tax=Bradyrhizobium sp. DN5 TaxID=3056950 RepID=UPI0035263337